jgi:hypothetical protein
MMMNLFTILVLILVLFSFIYSIFFLVSTGIEIISMLNIPAMVRGTWWQENVSAEDDGIDRKFPIGEERIFIGKYISHWEIARFEMLSINFQLDIPSEGGWDWLIQALGNPTTRSGYSGTFDLKFRGKIVEKGCFGHMGICAYRIEVIEILSATLLTQN